MADRILLIVSLAMLFAFMGVVATFVDEPDLWMVIILGLGLAVYDFWTTVRAAKRPGNGGAGASRGA